VADHFQDQKLGMQGASTLADVLKVNKTLQYLYCENNGIALTGHTDPCQTRGRVWSFELFFVNIHRRWYAVCDIVIAQKVLLQTILLSRPAFVNEAECSLDILVR
jgi:hypothetical protein